MVRRVQRIVGSAELVSRVWGGLVMCFLYGNLMVGSLYPLYQRLLNCGMNILREGLYCYCWCVFFFGFLCTLIIVIVNIVVRCPF